MGDRNEMEGGAIEIGLASPPSPQPQTGNPGDGNANHPPAPGTPQDTRQPGGGADDVVRELRRENDRLSRQVSELSASERFWSEKATAAQQPPPQPPNQPGEDEDEADPLDDLTGEQSAELLTTQGLRGLQKKGFVTKRDLKSAISGAVRELRETLHTDVRSVVGETVTNLGKQSQLVASNPELNDPNSDLFKEAQKAYKELITEDPAAKTVGFTFRVAVDMAKQRLGRTGQQPPNPEQDRLDRINRQRPEAARHAPANSPVDIDSDTRRMLAGMGVSEADYVQAKRGKR